MNIKILAVCIFTAGLCACTKWTEPEPLDISPKPIVPSEEYLKNLQAFKKSEHKTVVLGMEATSTVPTGRYQHLTDMPDSADYIFIRNLVGGLHRDIMSETETLRADKGTKLLADIEDASISDAWELLQETAEGTEQDFKAFVTEKVNNQLECCTSYGLDGIMVSFTGTSAFSETGRAVFMNTVMDWMNRNPSKTVFVRGILSILINNIPAGTELYDIKGFLKKCSGIIYQCGNEVSTNNVEMEIERIIDRGDGSVPKNRFLLEVTVPTPSDPIQYGISPVTAASWIIEPYETFTKKGLCIANAQDDYFLVGNSYGNINRAIRIMNAK